MGKHIKTVVTGNLKATVKDGGCGTCQTSCQSACKLLALWKSSL